MLGLGVMVRLLFIVSLSEFLDQSEDINLNYIYLSGMEWTVLSDEP